MSRAAQTHVAGRVFETPGLEDTQNTNSMCEAIRSESDVIHPKDARKTFKKYVFRHTKKLMVT